MYEHFYGLRELPFELTPNPQYLFLTPRHRAVLCNLQFGVTARRGVTVLIGEAGTGKTTMVRSALGLLRRDDVCCVYLNNPTLTRAEFVEFVAHGFGLAPEARQSKAVFLRDLESHLLARLGDGRVSALLIDEAQSLPHELLEETRLLANMETATDKLLPVVLVGQPELAARLNEPELRQLKQRVAIRCDLGPLQLQETASYISARLERAGGRPEIFTREAVEAIHVHSRGIPRTISVVADNALINGFRDESPPGRSQCRPGGMPRSRSGMTPEPAPPSTITSPGPDAVDSAQAAVRPFQKKPAPPPRSTFKRGSDLFSSFARRSGFSLF
jgi:type II secretory pathway predicted ATPase ExeA